jgi:glutathione S-transferase
MARPLYPRDDSARRRALMLEEFFDEEVGPQARAFFVHELFARTPDLALDFFALGHGPGHRRAMRALFPLFQALYRRRHNVSAATAREGRGRVLAALDRIEAELQPSGHLVGDEFTVADLTAAALLGGIAADPAHLQYPLPQPAWAVALRDSLAGRVGCQWLAQMYERHRGRSAEVAA